MCGHPEKMSGKCADNFSGKNVKKCAEKREIRTQGKNQPLITACVFHRIQVKLLIMVASISNRRIIVSTFKNDNIRGLAYFPQLGPIYAVP